MASKGKKLTVQEDNSAKEELAHRFKANPFLFIGTVIILIIVIIAFVLVPAIPGVSAARMNDLNFGAYDKAPIDYVRGGYFAQIQANIENNMRDQINESNYQYASYQVWRQAFEETVIHTGILQEMKKARYSAPPKAVDRQVALMPDFQENGRFSAARYERLDNNSRLALWQQIREGITDGNYRYDVTSLKSPAAEAEFISQMASPQRTFDMVAFSIDSYPDSEISAYAAANPGLFRTTHLSKITINSSEREAKQILKSIKDETTTFEDAARAHSQDEYTERGGDMGIKMAHELSIEVPESASETLTHLPKGEYSEIIKLETGWAFFRAEDEPYAADITDSAALDKVRSYINNFERGRMEDWAIALAENFIDLAKENTFDQAVFAQGLDKRHFGPFPANYGSVDLFSSLSSANVSELSGADSNENFWKTAFATPLLTPSAPVVQGSNILVLLPLEESAAEDTIVEYIASTLSGYWLSSNTEQSLRSYFLNSDKLEDRFFETYLRLFMPN
ncbi:MAG: peptidylprolyl isomerase [Treponema sp.]|jgi:hypothetical protein|nr:peptidylprolyl isomerase [Treponema sp.]